MEMTIRAYLRRAVSAALERSGREISDGTASQALRSARSALAATRTLSGAIAKHLDWEEVSVLIQRHDAELHRIRFGLTSFRAPAVQSEASNRT